MRMEETDEDRPEGGKQEAESLQPGGDAGAAAGTVDEWYYAAGGRSFGPVSEEELRALARAGHFGAEDYVFTKYFGDWVQAGSIYGLFEELPAGATGATHPVTPPPEGMPEAHSRPWGYASVTVRAAALCVDALIVVIPTLFIMLVTQFLLLTPVMSAPAPDPDFVTLEPAQVLAMLVVLFGVPIVFLTFVPWLYFALMESSRRQATIGKAALGLAVCNLDGGRIGFGRATARYFASLLSMLTAGLGFLMAAFTARRQTLHDMIAGTVVVYGRRG